MVVQDTHQIPRLIGKRVPDYNVLVYSVNTTTGVLRRHLQSVHLGDWVEECDRKGIQISGAKAQGAAADYRQRTGKRGSSVTIPGQRPCFTKEGFLNALIEFIVSDDQVSSGQVASPLVNFS